MEYVYFLLGWSSLMLCVLCWALWKLYKMNKKKEQYR